MNWVGIFWTCAVTVSFCVLGITIVLAAFSSERISEEGYGDRVLKLGESYPDAERREYNRREMDREIDRRRETETLRLGLIGAGKGRNERPTPLTGDDRQKAVAAGEDNRLRLIHSTRTHVLTESGEKLTLDGQKDKHPYEAKK